jgi:curved DNA-binding protein
VAVKFRDYYEVLGVPRTASADEIKRVYRQLARKHHPDLQPATERARASERFKEINEAYEVLSDPEKRSKYDALGASWKSGMDFTPPSGAGAPAAEAREWEDLGGFSDFFASLFGRPSSGGRRDVRITLPGSDIEAELPVTLEDLLRGGKRRLTLDGRSVDCERAAFCGWPVRGSVESGAGRRVTSTCTCAWFRTRAIGWPATIWTWSCRSGHGKRCSGPR